MADKNIGSLPQAAQLDDDSLLVAEQQGTAVKVTGAQFKEFGRQAVIGQVQGYVDQAQAAAAQAEEAVSAVTDMTVEAETLASGQDAAVTKSTKDGKVNLKFGLPRGEQGVPGPAGATGPRGPQGPAGKGLTILGYYDTLATLEAAVPAPEPGDAYGVGTAAPYDIYVFDGESRTWKNNGPLSGGGGVLPDDVVTAEGGAEMTFPLDLGDGPHTIRFVDEEEPPLTAEDIAYSDTQNVKQAIDDLKSSVSDGKALVASAITDKGVPTEQDATFEQMADNIGQISEGSDTSDATATSFDILAPKTAYTAAGKVEGTIPTLLGQTITPGTADKTIANGQYLGGTQVIKGDPNLTSGNIKSGVTLFGVEGALESTFQATLTVTADIGAVVTATHTSGTEVEALSTTGSVTLELPLEGTWSVTAVRGVAQYNTVTIQVSSSYSAELTAEVHIEYIGEITNLPKGATRLAATSFGNYALFGGGHNDAGYVETNTPNTKSSDEVAAYDENLTRRTCYCLRSGHENLAAAANNSYAVFAGGARNPGTSANQILSSVDAYSTDLTRTNATDLSVARQYLSGATIGTQIIFGGGRGYYTSEVYNNVDSYDEELVRTNPPGLVITAVNLAAASNDNYAIFAGGSSSGAVTAYNAELTRTIATSLGIPRSYLAAARAGNYVVFAGGNTESDESVSMVEAYDLFLTKTIPEGLEYANYSFAGATVGGMAVFGGGRSNGASVEVYDQFLTRTSASDFSKARKYHAAASVGNYALFGGGSIPNDSDTDSVEAYRYV